MYYICPECGTTVASRQQRCNECGCPIEYIKTYGNKQVETYSATTVPCELEAAAVSGNADAMYWLSYCLYYGENGFTEDETAAEEWINKAAAAGHSRAMTDLQEWFGVQATKPALRSIAAPTQKLRNLFSQYENIVLFDVETSGLSPSTDRIIEIGAIKVESKNGEAYISDQIDEMIKLPPGQMLNPKITELTGISNESLQKNGKDANQVCSKLVRLLTPNKTLMIAYNAQFDMSFLKSFLDYCGMGTIFNGLHALDAMTVYKDRREYPHKLVNAINAYGLSGTVQNSHKAIDDAKSLLAVLLAMDAERNDLGKYIDLFGFNPKWGINGPRLPGITYVAQPYNSSRRLYEC